MHQHRKSLHSDFAPVGPADVAVASEWCHVMIHLRYIYVFFLLYLIQIDNLAVRIAIAEDVLRERLITTH